jgi:hypothetical protein
MVHLGYTGGMTTQMVGSRELAAEVALQHMEKAEDFVRYMPTVQHWIRSNLFDAAGVGAVEQNPRRGKSRQFPVEALQWVRLFATLTNRGVATTEIEYVTSVLNQRFRDAIDDALARRGADVWLVYGSAAPLTYVLNLQIQRGGVRLSHDDGVSGPAVATCVNLTRIFNP